MPEQIVARVYGQNSDLFVYLPAAIRNRYEILVSDKLYCRLLDVLGPAGDSILKAGNEGWWEIKGYWHELHLPSELVEKLSLHPGHLLVLRLQKVSKPGRIITI